MGGYTAARPVDSGIKVSKGFVAIALDAGAWDVEGLSAASLSLPSGVRMFGVLKVAEEAGYLGIGRLRHGGSVPAHDGSHAACRPSRPSSFAAASRVSKLA